jgi:hypothetical protein
MKKLILIFSLLLSSINVSAERIADTTRADADFFISSASAELRQEQAQGSFDTYETFFEFNAQQGEGQSRVSDVLMFEAKMVAMYDLVAYAVSQTFQGIISRNPDADFDYQVTNSDIVEGINAAREIIGPLLNNPVFSVEDQMSMSRSVNYYFNQGWNSNDLTRGAIILNELVFRNLINRENFIYDSLGRSTRVTLARANKFSSNFLSTFFTNQNAVQSTCLSASCASPM